MLNLTQIDSYYGNIQAVRKLTLSVPEGSVVALLGPNGAGKTTTLRTITGLMRPRAGTIEFEGKRIDRMPAHEVMRLGISMAPERDEIFPEMSTAENLRLGAITRHDRDRVKQDIDWVTDLFPILGQRWSQTAATLSGGEQRMLSIARALLAKPKLLLFDEPSLGLAPVIVQDIYRAIREIRDTGSTILLVEQNARMALDLADSGYLLEAGEKVLEGTREELVGNDLVRKGYMGQL
jgi:branched-chain amino acid transport system ATP-binding protein